MKILLRIYLFSAITFTFSECVAQNKEQQDIEPTIIGGYDSLMQATQSLRVVPESCFNDHKKVYVQFTITAVGEVSDLLVLRGGCTAADSVAISIVKSIRFRPGRINGKKVEYKRVLGIPFLSPD